MERLIGEWTLSDDERFNEVMTALLRHLHEFAWEVRLTEGEWLTAVEFLKDTGKMCDDRRDEFQLLSDVVGLTSTVNLINHDVPEGFTESAVTGPFYVPGSPERYNGESMIAQERENGETALISGRVLDANGTPIPGAILDVWQASPDKLYAVQDASRDQSDLRGKFTTDEHGRYAFLTYKPPPYSIPRDGPVGRLLTKGGRAGMRPAHIHFIVSAKGYDSVTTQLFTHDDPYLWSDAVFGEMESLVVEYQRSEGADHDWTLDFDFRLMPEGSMK